MSDADEESDGARMMLEPDTLHEGTDELDPYLDCPSCGSPAPIDLIIEEGHCLGYIDGDVAESENYGEHEQLRDVECTADLSLELVWNE